MRFLVLSTFSTVLLDIVAWLFFHLAVSYWVTRRPAEKFSCLNGWYRPRSFEKETRLYRILRVHDWKSNLPDAAPWFAGPPKSKLPGRHKVALSLFLTETCRGELAHWLTFLCGPLFFLWNKPWVGAVMMFYAGLINFPCILVQRYNRLRLWRILNLR